MLTTTEIIAKHGGIKKGIQAGSLVCLLARARDVLIGRKGARSKRPWLPPIQKLTKPKFMSASQKRAHAEGIEIWV